jgi:hypothetical protein
MHVHLFDLTVLASIASPGASSNPIMFLYFGPEVVLPIASFLAAAAGVILMFWRQIVSFVRKGTRLVLRKGDAPVAVRDDLDMDLAITTASADGDKGKGE